MNTLWEAVDRMLEGLGEGWTVVEQTELKANIFGESPKGFQYLITMITVGRLSITLNTGVQWGQLPEEVVEKLGLRRQSWPFGRSINKDGILETYVFSSDGSDLTDALIASFIEDAEAISLGARKSTVSE